ncbi:MAG: DUF2508 family protein [Methylocystaceae bacterium]
MALLIRDWFTHRLYPDRIVVGLRAELQLAYQSLQVVYNQFDQAMEYDLIDASTYEIKAAELRYNWLLRQAKQAWALQAREG